MKDLSIIVDVIDGDKENGWIKVNYEYGEFIIHTLHVQDEEKKKGTGKFLLESSEKIIRTFGGKIAVLYVVENSWMEDWYKRNGYEVSNKGSYNDVKFKKKEPKYIRMEKVL